MNGTSFDVTVNRFHDVCSFCGEPMIGNEYGTVYCLSMADDPETIACSPNCAAGLIAMLQAEAARDAD